MTAVRQRGQSREFSAIQSTPFAERGDLLLDHCRPNVAGGTAKKCFGFWSRATTSLSAIALSGLSPSSSRKSWYVAETLAKVLISAPLIEILSVSYLTASTKKW